MHKRFSRCVALLSVLVLGTGLSLLMVKPSGAGTGKESKNQLISPARIAIGAEGNLLVSDYGAEAVVLLSKKNLKVLRTFSIAGRPLGIGWAGSFLL